MTSLGDAVHVWLLGGRRGADTLGDLLGAYLGVAGSHVRIEKGPAGKPRVAAGTGGVPLAFNVGHGGACTLVALSARGEVGVDVESLDRDVEGWLLARGQSGGEFLRTWVRKEALLKAAGVGLAVEPTEIELEGLDVVAVPPALGPASRWSLRDIALDGYAAALAVEGPVASVRLFDRREAG